MAKRGGHRNLRVRERSNLTSNKTDRGWARIDDKSGHRTFRPRMVLALLGKWSRTLVSPENITWNAPPAGTSKTGYWHSVVLELPRIGDLQSSRPPEREEHKGPRLYPLFHCGCNKGSGLPRFTGFHQKRTSKGVILGPLGLIRRSVTRQGGKLRA